jgi:tetratricopeptide (TPR) repeat protein
MEIGTKILDDFYFVQYSSIKEKFSTELPTVKQIIDSLQIDINSYNALTNKGIAHAELGEYEEAFRYYNKVLASDQSNIYALNNKGAAFIDLGNYEEAIETGGITKLVVSAKGEGGMRVVLKPKSQTA